MGPTGEACASEQPLSVDFAQCDAALNCQVERYFNMDTMDAYHGLVKDLSVEDRRARSKLEADTRIVDGRYEVPTLWKTYSTVARQCAHGRVSPRIPGAEAEEE